MKKIISGLIISIFVATTLVGCATVSSRPRPMHIENSRIVEIPFDIVWTQLIEYLSSKQIQLKTIDKDSGFVDTESMLLPSEIVADYAWTGEGLPTGLHPRGQIKANIFVKKLSASQTSVTVNPRVQVFQVYINQIAPGGWFDAKSTGKFESDILNIFQ